MRENDGLCKTDAANAQNRTFTFSIYDEVDCIITYRVSNKADSSEIILKGREKSENAGRYPC